MDYNNLSHIKDVRIYAQILLDFFESLAYSSLDFENLKKVARVYDQSSEPSFEDFFAHLKKHEFQILLQFSNILKAINQMDPKTEEFNISYGKRVGIALLLLRKKLDKLFIGRKLAMLDIDNVSILAVAKVINSFSKVKSLELSEQYSDSVSSIMNKTSQMKLSKFASETDN